MGGGWVAIPSMQEIPPSRVTARDEEGGGGGIQEAPPPRKEQKEHWRAIRAASSCILWKYFLGFFLYFENHENLYIQ